MIARALFRVSPKGLAHSISSIPSTAHPRLRLKLGPCTGTSIRQLSQSQQEPQPPHVASMTSSHSAQSTAGQTLERPIIRVSDILQSKPAKSLTIVKTTTVKDAISIMNKNSTSCCLATEKDGSLAGIFTARDILRFMDKAGSTEHGGMASALNRTVSDLMTRKEKVVYCSPSDSSRKCREMMFQTKVRNMPVIDTGEVVGIITQKDLADSAFNFSNDGGKKGYFRNITGRKGIPEGTKLAAIHGSFAARTPLLLDCDVGSFEIPHPYKSRENVASSRRQFGPGELSTDKSLCEDAHFALTLPGSSDGGPKTVYVCVADGVGSWRQYGVDPRNYAHKLVDNAKQAVELNYQLWKGADGDVGALLGISNDIGSLPIHPLDVIIDAWNASTDAEVTGSSTICVATLDGQRNQLSYSNLGDCGLVVVRHIDSETAGYMRERQLPRHKRQNDLRIAYLSQQQLRGFNRPYQLGFCNLPDLNWVGDNPQDADTASIPVMPGDIVILATDGLYDNLDLDEIVQEVSLWERKWFPRTEQEDTLSLPHVKGDEAVQALAKQLALKARELSLDTQRDSPFAVLAKENDIMWGGGMPDDTTVVVMRVVKYPALA